MASGKWQMANSQTMPFVSSRPLSKRRSLERSTLKAPYPLVFASCPRDPGSKDRGNGHVRRGS
jgi:hypothetical protein